MESDYSTKIGLDKAKEALESLKGIRLFSFVDEIRIINLEGLTEEESSPRASNIGLALVIDGQGCSIPIQNDLPLDMLYEIHDIEKNTGVKLYYFLGEIKEGEIKDSYHKKLLDRIKKAENINFN